MPADPKFAKLGNLSDIEAETVHIVSPPADCIRQQPHLVYSTAAAVPRTTTVQLSQSPSPAQAAQAAQAAHHVVLDENSAEWREQSR